MWAALPAVISAVASIGSSIYNNITNRKQANKQNEWNLNMWNKANQYNDPASQMNRLKQAGMNPNMYGTQIIGNNNAASTPSSADLANQNPIVDQSAAASLASAVGEYEVGQKNADANMKNAEAAETTSEANYLNAQTNIARQQVDALLAGSQMKVNAAEKDRLVALTAQANQETKNAAKQFDILDEKAKQEVIETARKKLEQKLYEEYGEQQILADLKLKATQANLNISQAHLARVNAMCAPILAEAAKNQATAALDNADTNRRLAESSIALNSSTMDKIEQEIETLKSQGELNEAEAAFFKSFTLEKLVGIGLTVASCFIPGGAVVKGAKAVSTASKASKAAKGVLNATKTANKVAKVATKASKAQKAAGKAMSRPTGSYRTQQWLDYQKSTFGQGSGYRNPSFKH